jgi:hypothetical protein
MVFVVKVPQLNMHVYSTSTGADTSKDNKSEDVYRHLCMCIVLHQSCMCISHGVYMAIAQATVVPYSPGNNNYNNNNNDNNINNSNNNTTTATTTATTATTTTPTTISTCHLLYMDFEVIGSTWQGPGAHRIWFIMDCVYGSHLAGPYFLERGFVNSCAQILCRYGADGSTIPDGTSGCRSGGEKQVHDLCLVSHLTSPIYSVRVFSDV